MGRQMTNGLRVLIYSSIAALIWCVMPQQAEAYPDNVRYGYANCASCHVSPTGGGLLTPYGRGASEEFLSTWTRPGEGAFLHGAAKTPDWLMLGGEVRALAFARDTNVYKSKGVIPMQMQGDAGGTYHGIVTAVASFGIYDQSADLRSAYVLGNIGEHVFVRAGRFFPAFGINTPEHTLVTRRGLGFDQGQESFNLEAGVVGESGEIVADAILKSGAAEISSEDTGGSVRAAWYAGGRSQIGVSLLSLKGRVWERQAYGVFATAGITQSLYLLSEIDQEQKTPVTSNDRSTRENARTISASKLGWEFVKGLHALATYESSVTTSGTYDPRLWSTGPGLQWFPRPHFELLAQVQQRYDATWSKKAGTLYTLMTHYNL